MPAILQIPSLADAFARARSPPAQRTTDTCLGDHGHDADERRPPRPSSALPSSDTYRPPPPHLSDERAALQRGPKRLNNLRTHPPSEDHQRHSNQRVLRAGREPRVPSPGQSLTGMRQTSASPASDRNAGRCGSVSRRTRHATSSTPRDCCIHKRIRLSAAAGPTLPIWNATSHADRHGHGCPSAPAMQRRPGGRPPPLATNS